MQATRNFLALVWPTQGNKAIVSIKDGIVRHYWFDPDQIEAAALKAVELAASGVDTYYALSGFAAQERKSEQVVAVKALWIDIDVGTGKEYPSRSAAAEALKQFLEATSLPVPLIVSSGYGLHAYWLLQQDVPLPEWQVLSNKLKALCLQHGLHADLKCTSDAARILRPIGTFNFKNGTPRHVRIANRQPITLDEESVRRALGLGAGDIFSVLAGQMPPGVERTSPAAFNEPVADFDQLLTKCATVRWAYDNQDKVGEPLWYDVLGIAGFCYDGPAAAHRASRLHPGYDKESTAKKLQHRISAAGPTTCERFRAAAGSQCASCPHDVTSPIVLGNPKNLIITPKVNALTAPPTHKDIRLIPYQFQVRCPSGKPDANGNQPWDWVRIATHGARPLLELRLQDSNGVASNYVWMETYNDKLQPQTHFVIPSQSITNSMQFGAECSKQGYYLEYETMPAAYRRFHKIMRTWVEDMKAAQGSVVTFKSFGWTGPDIANAKKDSFLLGTKLYNKDGTYDAPIIPALATYQYHLHSQGSLSEWTRAVDNYNLPGMEAYMYLSWIAFGAPLMCFTNNGSIIAHIMGDTGAGKTSLQRTILSVYGEYLGQQLLDVNTSTLNSVGKTMGLFNSLPYCKEEATDTDVQELASWALTVSQGREKGRMNQNLGISPASTWSTIGCTSGNLSLRERVATARQDNAARLARIWEQELALPIDQTEASRLFAPLRNNYGVAGPIYVRYLVDNHDHVRERVGRSEEQLATKLKAQGADRFIIGFLAAIFTGAQIATELNLIHHDLSRGMNYAVQQYRQLRRAAIREKKTPEQNLARFIQEMQPFTLVVEHDTPGTAMSVFDSDNNIVRNVSLNNPITMRFAVKNSYFYASITILRKWYSDNHINFDTDLKAMELAGILIDRDKRMVLSKGTKLADRKQAWCMVFDLSKSADLVDAPLVAES